MKKKHVALTVLLSIVAIVLILALSLGAAAVAVMGFFASPWLIMAGYIAIQPTPPKPEITKAEFPFEIVYTLDGEEHTVNDVYVCEFAGYSANEGSMRKKREWSGYVKSTGEESLVLLLQEHDEDLVTTVYVGLGNERYYMDDPWGSFSDPFEDPPKDAFKDYENKPNLYVITDSKHFTLDYNPNNYEIIEERGISIVSYTFSQPIENSYSEPSAYYHFWKIVFDPLI